MSNQGKRDLYNTQIEPYLHEIYELRREGLSIDAIASYFGVSKGSFITYKKNHAPLAQAVKKGDIQYILDVTRTSKKALMNALTDRVVEDNEDTTRYDADTDSMQPYQHKTIHKTIPADTKKALELLKALDPATYDPDRHAQAVASVERMTQMNDKRVDVTDSVDDTAPHASTGKTRVPKYIEDIMPSVDIDDQGGA